MLRVVVTGAGGFVGAHLSRTLAARGDQVFGFGLGAPSNVSSLAGWQAGDVLDREALCTAVAVARPDAVVHLAGQSSAAVSFERPVETYRANATGTWNLLDAIRLHAPAARVVVVGSGEVYGPQPEGSRVAEDVPFRPVSPYALSKAAADALADAFARRHGLAVIRTRSFGHTGPGQAPVFAVSSFARQIARIEAGDVEPVLRVGNLNVTRDISDVRDVVEAYISLIDRGRINMAYNICSGTGLRLSWVVSELCERARRRVRVEVEPARMRPADLPWLVGDPSAVHRDTGWGLTRPIQRTLEDVLEYWRSEPG